MALIEEGAYPGTTVAASIYEAPSGAVMCSMVIDINGEQFKGGICLVQKDGTLSERGFKDVQEIFGWRDWDWDKWGQEPETFAGAAVQVKIETIQGDRGAFSSIKYINPAGGGQRLEKANAKGLAAKYGAKTRALFGGAPAAGSAKPAAPVTRPAPAAPPPPPQAAPSLPALNVPPSSMEACWEAFCRENPGKAERDLYREWSEYILTVTSRAQNDCTPGDWGLVLYRLNAGQLPF
jgi:hypothetical protein